MKELRDQAKASAKAKIARMTGGYEPEGKAEEKAKPFSKRSAPAEKSAGDVKGDKAKPRMDRQGFKHGGKVKGKGATNVNVIIASKPDAQAVPVPVPAGGPPGPMPPGPPPMPPPGAGLGAGVGGPPMPPRPGMPMRKRGGRVKVPDGGKVKMTAGSYSGEGRMQKARAAKRGR